MVQHGFHHLPVVEGKQVRGVIRLRDSLAARIRRPTPPTAPTGPSRRAAGVLVHGLTPGAAAGRQKGAVGARPPRLRPMPSSRRPPPTAQRTPAAQEVTAQTVRRDTFDPMAETLIAARARSTGCWYFQAGPRCRISNRRAAKPDPHGDAVGAPQKGVGTTRPNRVSAVWPGGADPLSGAPDPCVPCGSGFAARRFAVPAARACLEVPAAGAASPGGDQGLGHGIERLHRPGMHVTSWAAGVRSAVGGGLREDGIVVGGFAWARRPPSAVFRPHPG